MKNRISQLLALEPTGQSIEVEGWVRTKRDSKNVCFIDLNDGSTLKGLQIVIEHENFDSLELLPQISTGAAICCRGILVASAGTNQKVELKAQEIDLIGSSPVDTYPLQKKRHTLEYLREIAHLRPRTNTIGAVTRVRNVLAYAIHQFFQERGFVYINTPIITSSDAEGAGEQFTVTTLDLANPSVAEDGTVDYAKDFFGKHTKLTVSGQLEGEAYALALKDIYTFGPTFRAENSNTKRHLAEFWMVEPEMAFCTLEGNMKLAEDFLKFVLTQALERCQEDLAFFSQHMEKGLLDVLQTVVERPFSHITYTDAMVELAKNKASFQYPIEWGGDLQTEHERFLSEEVFQGPVIVTDYPREIKAFYMKRNPDGKTVRAMDVLVPRLGEIIGGSERENELEPLLLRLKEANLNPEDYWWYLDLRRYGSVPHSGFGLGFERLVQYATGMQNIRDVIPFPRAVRQADF